MAADPHLIALFARGWAMTRDVAPPEPLLGGHYIAVGKPDQTARYIFPSLDAEVLGNLAASIAEPWIYLKVCAEPDRVKAVLPAEWTLRVPPTFMMTARLRGAMPVLPDGYRLDLAVQGSIVRGTINRDDIAVAKGRIALLGDTALFDQVETDAAHRRKGLGRALMLSLAHAALDRNAPNGLLSATEMGRWLYESIGWTVHSPYTSAVIER